MRFTFAFGVLALLVTACAPTTPDDRVGVGDSVAGTQALPGPSEQGGTGSLADQELCDAASYRILVGSSVDDTNFPVGPRLRVFGMNDIITQDYIPQRTNVVFGGSREIIRVYCG
ncbi:MAG: hypothetical protein AAGA06_04860 [Pseudomonadota bacterium]